MITCDGIVFCTTDALAIGRQLLDYHSGTGHIFANLADPGNLPISTLPLKVASKIDTYGTTEDESSCPKVSLVFTELGLF